MKLFLASIMFLLQFLPINAQSGKKIDYKVNDAKQIVVQKFVEGLSLTKGDIYSLAGTFMADAYDPAKIKISSFDETNGTIIGEGTLVNFFNYQLGFNQYYLNMNFKLRVDAKDNRARISMIADNYSGKCIDNNTTTEVADRIAEFMPVNKANDSKSKMYTKAFPKMLEVFNKIIDDLTRKLQSAQGSVGEDNDW